METPIFSYNDLKKYMSKARGEAFGFGFIIGAMVMSLVFLILLK